MKKIIVVALLVSTGCALRADISSAMKQREVTSSPLSYKVMNYAEKQLSIEFEPYISGMFNPQHTIANLTPNGSNTLSLNQQGLGDINPEWLVLGSNDANTTYYDPVRDYQSTIQLTPELFLDGLLFHVYKQFDHFFFDIKTALLQAKSIVNLVETSGGNGGLTTDYGITIYNAYEAFTQPDWNFGKIGQSNSLIGFDNIQVTFGASTDMPSFTSNSTQTYFAGFAIVEVPTGQGTTAQWLFEPQVGTNHWAVGFGADLLVAADNGFSVTAGGNYRHFIANWETRSFDLTNNGPWSRYLGLDTLANIAGGISELVGQPGINLFTTQALIEGRDQITLYSRLEKSFDHCFFEISYNYFYTQKETINLVKAIKPGYGIFDITGGVGGVTTASTAKINQSIVVSDDNPIAIVTSDLNLASGAMQGWQSNTIAARIARQQEGYTYGVGAAVDLAHSAQAVSSWSVWANFEILL